MCTVCVSSNLTIIGKYTLSTRAIEIFKWAEFSANHFVEYSVASGNSYKKGITKLTTFCLISSSLTVVQL